MFNPLVFIFALAFLISCKTQQSPNITDNVKGTLYRATVVTMDDEKPEAESVMVVNGKVHSVGSFTQLKSIYPNATINQQFKDKVILPGLIDPHIHLFLGAMLYSKPMVPPWDMQSLTGSVKGLTSKQAFLTRVKELWQQHKQSEQSDKPLIIYGYHHLVHGDLTRIDLDKIATDGDLLLWHYSAHDFYFNSHAIQTIGATPELAEQYHGFELFESGENRGTLTGRIYEDASAWLLPKIAPYILDPASINYGYNGLMQLLKTNGVTTGVEMAYGIFGRVLEDQYHKALYLNKPPKVQLYLVPEYRAFKAEFKDKTIETIQTMVAQSKKTQLPVLPKVKFFTDAAYYSQTMRFEDTYGQAQGLWVTQPDNLEQTLQPYWDAGLSLHIHSNGDLAQSATLNVIKSLTANSRKTRLPRTVIEHAGLVLPEHIQLASHLNVGISAASHYVYFLGEDYKKTIGDKANYITPLASTLNARVPSALHSDAPLAPPAPLAAAARHMLRTTYQQTVVGNNEKLTAKQALSTITTHAAWVLGLEEEIGSIEKGKKANFTIVDRNPLITPAEQWLDIKVETTVLEGVISQ